MGVCRVRTRHQKMYLSGFRRSDLTFVSSNRWGSTYYMELEQSDINVQREEKKLIGQWRATSISGNDLIASVLYSLGPCMVQAGQFSAISMALVALLMYPAKNIMTEVCTALPLNGGMFNMLVTLW
jgi:hypothetical protein